MESPKEQSPIIEDTIKEKNGQWTTTGNKKISSKDRKRLSDE